MLQKKEKYFNLYLWNIMKPGQFLLKCSNYDQTEWFCCTPWTGISWHHGLQGPRVQSANMKIPTFLKTIDVWITTRNIIQNKTYMPWGLPIEFALLVLLLGLLLSTCYQVCLCISFGFVLIWFWHWDFKFLACFLLLLVFWFNFVFFHGCLFHDWNGEVGGLPIRSFL